MAMDTKNQKSTIKTNYVAFSTEQKSLAVAKFNLRKGIKDGKLVIDDPRKLDLDYQFYDEYFLYDEAIKAASEIGDGWRLPTREDFEFLVDEFKWGTAKIGTEYGLLFYNGFSEEFIDVINSREQLNRILDNTNQSCDVVIFPCRGQRNSNLTIFDAGSEGRYWSSTPHDYNTEFAYSFEFSHNKERDCHIYECKLSTAALSFRESSRISVRLVKDL